MDRSAGTPKAVSRRDSGGSIFVSRLNREIPLLSSSDTPLPPFLKLSSHDWISPPLSHNDPSNRPTPAPPPSCSLFFELSTTTTANRYATVTLTTTLNSESYPFSPPEFTLLPNPHLTPGRPIPLSLAWTPSLTVLDCVLDVAVRVRECIKSDDSFESLVGMAPSPSTPEGKKAPVATPERRRSSGLRRPSFKPANFASVLDGTIGSTLLVSDLPNLHPATNIRRLGSESSPISSSPLAPPSVNPDRRASRLSMASSSVWKSLSSAATAATSVLSETYLTVTPTHILELKSSKFNLQTCTVQRRYAVSGLAKLKFRRGESVSFTFKQSPTDQLVYLCQTSGELVQEVQRVMSSRGVSGKHTSASEARLIESAVALVTTIQVKENILLTEAGSPALVEEIMDLYRQSAEKFALAGDDRHVRVLELMKGFLSQEKVTKILDGTQAEKMGGEFSDEESEGEEEEEMGEETVVEEEELVKEEAVKETETEEERLPVHLLSDTMKEEEALVDLLLDKAREEPSEVVKKDEEPLVDLLSTATDPIDELLSMPAPASAPPPPRSYPPPPPGPVPVGEVLNRSFSVTTSDDDGSDSDSPSPFLGGVEGDKVEKKDSISIDTVLDDVDMIIAELTPSSSPGGEEIDVEEVGEGEFEEVVRAWEGIKGEA